MEEDLNFSNGRQPQFCSRQPRELIFRMQDFPVGIEVMDILLNMIFESLYFVKHF